MKKIRIKAKEKEGIVKVKVLLTHEMLTYNQAKKRGVKANFITRVIAKVGEKTVYELSSSQFLSKNPLLKFKFRGNKGEVLEIAWIDLSGAHASASKMIK